MSRIRIVPAVARAAAASKALASGSGQRARMARRLGHRPEQVHRALPRPSRVPTRGARREGSGVPGSRGRPAAPLYLRAALAPIRCNGWLVA